MDCQGCSGYGAHCSSASDNRCVVGVSYLEGSDWKGKIIFLLLDYMMLMILSM